MAASKLCPSAYGFAVHHLASLWWANRSRWTLLLLFLTEGFTLMLVLLARPARFRDVTLAAVLLNLYDAFSYVLFDPRTTTQFVPELAGAVFQVARTTTDRTEGACGPYRRAQISACADSAQA